MGQKINPNIYRLGISKTWKTAYYENYSKELPLYMYKDSNFLQFIDRYLINSNIIIHDLNYHFNNSTFILYTSYFVSPLFRFNVNNNKQLKDILVLLNKQSKKKKSVKNDFKIIPQNNNNFTRSLTLRNFKDYKKKLYIARSSLNSVDSRLLSAKNNKIKSLTKNNRFLMKLNHILNLFLGSNAKVLLCFNCINKDFSYLKNLSKNQIKILKRFNRLPVFKESIELFLYIISNKKSSNLLAKFLSQQFQKTKRQNFFLKFIRQMLAVLLRASFSRYKGIKIMVSGRLNGAPRAKHKIITIGDVSVTSINKKIDYTQTFCHNSNGSYGIKVWMAEI